MRPQQGFNRAEELMAVLTSKPMMYLYGALLMLVLAALVLTDYKTGCVIKLFSQDLKSFLGCLNSRLPFFFELPNFKMHRISEITQYKLVPSLIVYYVPRFAILYVWVLMLRKIYQQLRGVKAKPKTPKQTSLWYLRVSLISVFTLYTVIWMLDFRISGHTHPSYGMLFFIVGLEPRTRWEYLPQFTAELFSLPLYKPSESTPYFMLAGIPIAIGMLTLLGLVIFGCVQYWRHYKDSWEVVEGFLYRRLTLRWVFWLSTLAVASLLLTDYGLRCTLYTVFTGAEYCFFDGGDRYDPGLNAGYLGHFSERVILLIFCGILWLWALAHLRKDGHCHAFFMKESLVRNIILASVMVILTACMWNREMLVLPASEKESFEGSRFRTFQLYAELGSSSLAEESALMKFGSVVVQQVDPKKPIPYLPDYSSTPDYIVYPNQLISLAYITAYLTILYNLWRIWLLNLRPADYRPSFQVDAPVRESQKKIASKPSSNPIMYICSGLRKLMQMRMQVLVRMLFEMLVWALKRLVWTLMRLLTVIVVAALILTDYKTGCVIKLFSHDFTNYLGCLHYQLSQFHTALLFRAAQHMIIPGFIVYYVPRLVILYVWLLLLRKVGQQLGFRKVKPRTPQQTSLSYLRMCLFSVMAFYIVAWMLNFWVIGYTFPPDNINEFLIGIKPGRSGWEYLPRFIEGLFFLPLYREHTRAYYLLFAYIPIILGMLSLLALTVTSAILYLRHYKDSWEVVKGFLYRRSTLRWVFWLSALAMVGLLLTDYGLRCAVHTVFTGVEYCFFDGNNRYDPGLNAGYLSHFSERVILLIFCGILRLWALAHLQKDGRCHAFSRKTAWCATSSLPLSW